MAKTNHVTDIHVSYNNNQINSTHTTNFLGLIIGSTFIMENSCKPFSFHINLCILCN